jgi:hypothetical protein
VLDQRHQLFAGDPEIFARIKFAGILGEIFPYFGGDGQAPV